MTIIGLLITLVIIGVVLWAVNQLIPMDAKIKTILNVVVVIVVLLWLYDAFVGSGPLPFGRLRH